MIYCLLGFQLLPLQILQTDEVSHSSNQLRGVTGIDGRLKQTKSSLPSLWQPQHIRRCFCFPDNCLRRRLAMSSIWALSSPCVSSPSPSVFLHAPHRSSHTGCSLKPHLYCNSFACSTYLISLIFFFLRNDFLLAILPQIRHCLLAALSVYSGLITIYLIYPGGQLWKTSKQKFEPPLRALWVWVTTGTVSLHQGPCHPCFWSEINIYKWIIDSIYNIPREGMGEICMFGALQRHT